MAVRSRPEKKKGWNDNRKDGRRRVDEGGASGFKEKRSVCLWNRGVNREFNRDEEGMVEAEWEEEDKKKPTPKQAVFKSTTVRETHKREKKGVGGKTLHRERRQM